MAKVLVGLMPAQVPRLNGIAVDGRVLNFAFLISVVSGIIFGLAPALRTSKIDLAESLKESWSRSGSDGKAHGRFRRALVSSEIALAMVLLIGASLLLQSFVHLTRVDPGFDPHDVLTFQLDAPGTQPEGVSTTFFREVTARIKALPGVTSVSAAASLPLTGDNITSSIEIERQPIPLGSRPAADFNAAEPGYFRTIGISLVRGRDFSEYDSSRTKPVVIVNHTFAAIFPEPGSYWQARPTWYRQRLRAGRSPNARDRGCDRRR